MPIELPRKPYDRGRRDGRRGLVPISPWSPPAPTWTPLERQATWPGSAPAQQKGEGGPKDEEAAPENEGARLARPRVRSRCGRGARTAARLSELTHRDRRLRAERRDRQRLTVGALSTSLPIALDKNASRLDNACCYSLASAPR